LARNGLQPVAPTRLIPSDRRVQHALTHYKRRGGRSRALALLLSAL
jgi:hypothetical protein